MCIYICTAIQRFELCKVFFNAFIQFIILILLNLFLEFYKNKSYISNKLCSFDLPIYQRIQKKRYNGFQKILSSTTIDIKKLIIKMLEMQDILLI